MAWIPLSNRPAALKTALEQALTLEGASGTVEEHYNQQEYGLLSNGQLEERIAPMKSQAVPAPQTLAEPAASPPALPSPMAEGDAFQVKSLRYLRNSADRPEDRRWAETLHDSMLLELWLQHVTESGDTYYPPLAGDLFDSYQLLEEGHHS
jgi:hypothetical protein